VFHIDVCSDKLIMTPLFSCFACVFELTVNQKLISLILQKFGYQPDVAWNGREVIQVMEQAKQRYDIIFMDVQMPEMSGIECTQYIRKNFSRNEQPLAIIALTANAMCGDQEKFIKCGMVREWSGLFILMQERPNRILRSCWWFSFFLLG
jgi:CheY-like chemotaxis protein